ncbi:MAG: aspartate aminotransferase family protein [Candidatus Thorarchaeota archaeon]|jgi:4-aminobutyrate aminotransferase
MKETKGKRIEPPAKEEAKDVIDTILNYEAPLTSGWKAVSGQKWPVLWHRGEGAVVEDIDGNKYVDLSAGFAVANVGHCHPKVVAAIIDQSKKMIHTASRAPHALRAELLKMLVERSGNGLNRVVFRRGGSEATETAMKLAKHFTRKTEFIAFQGGFHGLSHATLAVSANSVSKKSGYLPLLAGNVTFVPYPYCYRCMFGKEYPECDLQCYRYLETLLNDPFSGLTEIAAVMVEPIQAAGGVTIPPEEYMPLLSKLCEEKQIPLIVDEIQVGLGRTGSFLASSQMGLTPDFVALGKGLAGGLAGLSVVIGKGEILDHEEGYASGTFAANPVCCAAAIACLKAIDDDQMMENSAKLGQYTLGFLRDLMTKHDIIGDVRGKGLLIGMELVEDRKTKKPASEKAKAVAEAMVRSGFLIDTAGHFGNVVKMTPPLVINQEQMDSALEQLDSILDRIEV